MSPRLAANRTIAVAIANPVVPDALVSVQVTAKDWLTGTTNADGYVAWQYPDSLGDSAIQVAADGYQPYETPCHWKNFSDNPEPPPLNHQLTIGVDLPPLHPLTPARLQVEGLGFVDEHGEPWRMAFVSSFRLYERFLRGEDIRPVLQETRDVGANGVRVFGSFDFGSPDVQRLYPREHPDYYDQLRPFFALLASYGLYGQFTVFADTQRSVPGEDAQYAHWGNVFAALADVVPNVLLERVNEADSHENRVDADVPRPLGILASNGSNGAGADPPGPFWDYADLHSERRGDFALSTTTLHYAIHGYGTAYPGTQRATVASEPPGFADTMQPGRRTNDPQIAYLMGLGCGWGAGGTAHSDCGVQSVLMTPTQRACVEQFILGARSSWRGPEAL